MNKSGRKVNPDFFKQQQNDDVQVFVGKRPTTSHIAQSSNLQPGSSRPSTSILPEETKAQSSRLLPNKSKPIITSKTTRKEPILPQQHEESLYEMTKYLNKQTRDYYTQNEDSFQENPESQLFKRVQQHTLRMDDLEDSYNESDTLEDDTYSPQSIHESPIKKPLPSHRRSLSARMLPNMGRGFTNPRREESEEDSPIKEQMKEDEIPKRKAPRYPASLLKNSIPEEEVKFQIPISSPHNNIELRKLQEDVSKLSGEVNFLRREKAEQTKIHNEKIRTIQERHTEELQNQQKRFENLLEDKETRISDLQRENERLREQLGVTDKSKDGQDTNKLLNDLENKRKSISQLENEKLILTDLIEKLKYDVAEYSRQLKENDIKIRHKEETLNGLSNKIETQEKEIKNLREREFKEINEREKALAMYTECEKVNQQLQEKLKNLEFQSKQIQRESEILSQRCNSLETTKIQLEKTNDQLRAKLQMMEEDMNHISQEQTALHQDREQFQLINHRSQQELEKCRKEILSLHETINILQKEKSTNSFEQKGPNDNSLFNSNNLMDNPNYGYYQPNLNFHRKNTNIPLSTYPLPSQGLLGNENSNSYRNNTMNSSNPREPNQNQYDYNSKRESQKSHIQQQSLQNLNTRYQQQSEPLKEPSIETPKHSATTTKVMSIINRESPKERQHNRNKVMGTSYSLTPFALDDNASTLQTANIDEQLMQLSLEKTRLEGDMQKLFSVGIKSIAAKKQKMSLELRLEEIEKQSSQLKMKLRNMNY